MSFKARFEIPLKDYLIRLEDKFVLSLWLLYYDPSLEFKLIQFGDAVNFKIHN